MGIIAIQAKIEWLSYIEFWSFQHVLVYKHFPTPRRCAEAQEVKLISAVDDDAADRFDCELKASNEQSRLKETNWMP